MTTAKQRPRLSRQVQCRFTDSQFDLVQEIADELGRPISAVVRDVVTVWAMQFRKAQDEQVDVAGMVAELQSLEDES